MRTCSPKTLEPVGQCCLDASSASRQAWLVNSAPTAEALDMAMCPDGDSLALSRTLEEGRTELGLLVGKASLQKKRDVRCSGFGKTGILLVRPRLPVRQLHCDQGVCQNTVWSHLERCKM